MHTTSSLEVKSLKGRIRIFGIDQPVIISLFFMGWMLEYFDKNIMNIALPAIGKEFGTSASGLGIVLSSYFLGYAIMQIPGGWLADKFGAKWMMVISFMAFSLFTGVTGLAWSVVSLIVFRFLFGIAIGSFPSASIKGLSENYPKEKRTGAMSIITTTNPLTTALAPLIGAPLIVFFGWHGMFFVFAIIGGMITALYWKFYKTPEQSQNSAPEQEGQAHSFVDLIRNSVLWKILVINFCIHILMWGFLSWLPSYMVDVRGLDLIHAGILSSLPGFAGVVGILGGGWAADRLFKGHEKYLLSVSIAVSALCLFLMIIVDSLILAVIFQIILNFTIQFAFMVMWSLPLKMMASDIMGSSVGFVNLASQIAGIISPAVMGFLITLFNGSYVGAFSFLIIAAIVAVIFSMLLRNTQGFSASGSVN